MANLESISERQIHFGAIAITVLCLCRIRGEFGKPMCVAWTVNGHPQIVFAGSAAVLVQSYAP
jgi:hypothetical protein